MRPCAKLMFMASWSRAIALSLLLLLVRAPSLPFFDRLLFIQMQMATIISWSQSFSLWLQVWVCVLVFVMIEIWISNRAFFCVLNEEMLCNAQVKRTNKQTKWDRHPRLASRSLGLTSWLAGWPALLVLCAVSWASGSLQHSIPYRNNHRWVGCFN